MAIWGRAAVGGFGVLVIASGLAIGCKTKQRATESTEVEATKETKGPAPITDDAIRLVEISSFTGAQAGTGTEYYRGAMAEFLEVNARGGVHGRKIEVIPIDDKYQADLAEAATERAITEEHPFLIFGSTGTGTLSAQLKVLKKYEAQKIWLWGTSTGSEASREGELAPLAFNVRGGGRRAAADGIDALAAGGAKKLGIVGADDEFGKSAAQYAREAAQKKGLPVVSEVVIAKNARPDTTSVVDLVQKMRAAGVEGIILAATYNPTAAFTKDAREQGWNVPLYTLGSPDTALRLLVAHEKKTGRRMTNAFMGISGGPPIGADEMRAVREYRDLMDRRNPRLPSEVADPNYRSLRYSTIGLEGFLTARILVEALERAGHELTTDSFRKAVESIQNWDAGVDQTVTFGPNDNQGFDSVWSVGVKNDEFFIVKDFKAYMTAPPAPVVKEIPDAGVALAADQKK